VSLIEFSPCSWSAGQIGARQREERLGGREHSRRPGEDMEGKLERVERRPEIFARAVTSAGFAFSEPGPDVYSGYVFIVLLIYVPMISVLFLLLFCYFNMLLLIHSQTKSMLHWTYRTRKTLARCSKPTLRKVSLLSLA
jgi:hypothetical protein